MLGTVLLWTYISCSRKYDKTLSVVFELMPDAWWSVSARALTVLNASLTCARQLHFTLRRLVNCTNDIQQGSFASARQTIHDNELAALDTERDTSVDR